MSYYPPTRLLRQHFVHTGRVFAGRWQDLLMGVAVQEPGPPPGDGLDHGGDHAWLHLVLSGRATVRTRTGLVRLEPGGFAWWRPDDIGGMPQAAVANTALALIRLDANLYRNAEALGWWPAQRRTGLVVLDPLLLESFERLLRHGARHAASPQADWPLPEALVWMQDVFAREAQPRTGGPDWLPMAKELLEGDEADRLPELARRLGLGYDAFRRRFRSETGLPPRDFALRARLARAGSLLLSGLPAAEAALRTGFCDASQFGKMFRRHYGCAPRAWVAGRIAYPRLSQALGDMPSTRVKTREK